jgi:hypothetical protein
VITRSLDPRIMKAAFAPYDRYHDDRMNYEAWLTNGKNIMYVTEDGDVGLATFEYPGMYNVHWFFKNVKGKAAIALAKEMLDDLFTNYKAEVVRGLTPVDIKAARFLAKYVGFKSYGLVDAPEDDGPNKGVCELMIMTKNEFYDYGKGQVNGS